MGKKPNLADLQTKVLVVALGSERRWKRIALFGAGLLVLVGGAAFVAVGALDTKAKETQAGAWSSLSACLVGAPLGERETAGQRVRAIQLGVLGVPREKRSKGSELPWPARCATAAHSLAESTKTLGGDKSPLAGAAEVLAKVLTDNAVAVNDMRTEVDKLWKEATSAGLKAGAAPAGVTAAPAPATFFTNEQFRELPRFLSGSFTLASVKAEQTVGERITLLVDQKDLPEGPVVCTLGATDTALKCVKVPPAAAKLSPGLRLVGTVEQGARPFLFAGDRGQLGIFPPEGGDKVAAAPALGATARADGSLWVLTRREPKDARLLLQPATGVGVERPLLSALELESATHAGLFWDHILYRGKTATTGAHLFARKLPPTAMGEPSPAIDVGALDEPAPADAPNEDDQLSACRSTDGIAVRVRGAKSDAIAFLAGGRWSAPVKMGHKGGALTCRGLEAVATKVTTAMEGDKNLATIAQARCNTGGCTPASTSMKEVLGGTEAIAPSDANGVTAADVNGKLLVAWNGGYTGGVRLRVAPIERMRDGEDVVVCDARDEGSSQRLTTALEVRAIPASGFALLLVGTTSGVRALRVDPAGKLTPLGATLQRVSRRKSPTDYKVGLVLFDQVLARLSARGVDRITSPGLLAVPPSGARYLETQGAVRNALYVNPTVRFRPLDAGDHALDLRLGWLFARSAADLVDPYSSAKVGGYAATYGGKSPGSRALGHELDASAKYTVRLPGDVRLRGGAEAGVLFAGAAFSGLNLGKPWTGRLVADVVW